MRAFILGALEHPVVHIACIAHVVHEWAPRVLSSLRRAFTAAVGFGTAIIRNTNYKGESA